MGEIIKKDDLKSNIQSVWGTNDSEQLENIANEVTKSAKKTNLKHGLFANIPLICRGKLCPYNSACPIENKPVKERCPVEIGAILSRFESHCEHFGIRFDEKGKIHNEDVVDSSMIRDLVDIEIQILRADNKLAIDGDFIGQTVSAVTEQGQVYYDDVVTPAAEFKMTLLKQKNKLLEKLNATRKDKSNALKDDHTSQQSKHLLQRVSEITKNQEMIEIDFEDVNLDEVKLDDLDEKEIKIAEGIIEEEKEKKEKEEKADEISKKESKEDFKVDFDDFDDFDDIDI